jgi:twitching motility protein PilT
MAAIDALLRALQRHQMDSLVLVPGHRPRLRQADQEHPVTKTNLDGDTLAQLLAEIAPAGTDPRPGGDFGFDYTLEGTTFRFTGGGTGDAWSAQAAASVAAPMAAPTTAPEDPPAGAEESITAPSEPAAELEAPAAAPDTPAAPSPGPPERPISAITDLLQLLVERGASDLHLTVGQRPRIRLDGELEELTDFEPPSTDLLDRLLHGITPENQHEAFSESSDADFAYELPGQARFRVNLFRNRTGAAAVFRQIPHAVPTFEQLGLPDHLRRLAELAKGLVLVTGPTGSGKSTTLAALIDLVNETRRDHIITIEDPIEFVHPSKGCLVNQREVGVHTASFKRALRAALREDPDIVLVGEMRDLETTAIAIETAETGHLVFGTPHTTTAASTVERVVDQFPGDRQEQIRIMLSESLRAVIAQTLLKRVGGGRVAAFEILVCTPAVSNLIREGKTFQIPSALQTGKAMGMCQMTDSLFKLVESGVVEPREAYLKATDKEALLSKFRSGDIAFEPAAPARAEA